METEGKMIRFVLISSVFLLTQLSAGADLFAQEDPIGRAAVEAIRNQMRVPKEMEIKFLEKQESAIPDFYAVKVVIVTADKEVPKVLYIDKTMEKVIFGDLFIKGENITRKMAGDSKPRGLNPATLEMDRSPSRGAAGAKVTIIKFSNFQCSFCMRSWANMQKIMEKNPKDIRYVFKHLVLQAQGKSFEISEMAAAVQEVNSEAFWAIHDFLYTQEGQNAIKGEKETIKQKFMALLKEKGYDGQAFQNALEAGKGKLRLEADMALAKKHQITRAPTAIINGQVHAGLLMEKVIEDFIRQ
jgi:protein-disulfide isomerase